MKKFTILFLLLMLIGVVAADTFTIGDGTSTQNYIPNYGWYDYSWSKTIYTEAEMSTAGFTAGEMTGIGYYVGTTPSNYTLANQRVYIRHTTASMYESADNTLPDNADFQSVYMGSVTYDGSGWHDISFNTPFAWDGSQNIEILWENWSGSYASGYPGFRYTATTNNTAAYASADGSFPSTSAGSLTTNRPNLRIHGPATTPPNAVVLVSPADGGEAFANDMLTWVPAPDGAGPTSYDVYFGTSATPPMVSSGQTAMFYDPVLTVGTTYYWNVVGHNSIGAAPASPTWSFTVVSGVVIGNGTATQRFPLGSFYGYERSAALYLASEIGPQNSSISAISWYSTNATTAAVPTKIFLKATTENALTNDVWDAMISGASLHYDQVQTGLMPDGWNQLSLDSEFILDEGQNLMVLVERNYGGGGAGGAGGSSTGGKLYSTAATGQHLTWHRDSSAPTTNGTTASIRPNVKINYTAFTYDTPPNPAHINSPADGATYVVTSSTLNWTAPSGAIPTGYKLFFGTDNPPTNIENNTDLGNVLSYNPGGLAHSTTHYWQVVPYNTYGESTDCPIWSFTTGGLPLRGQKTIDPAGSGPDNFSSFTEAITALNGAGVGQDGVVFNVPAGLSFNEAAMIPAIIVTGTADNPISFVKSGAGANPVVTVPGTSGATDYVFKLAGVDYVTFDGIDVSNAAGTTDVEYGYLITDTPENGGSSYNVIQNCTVTLDRSNHNSMGVYSKANSAQNNNNTYYNITVNHAYQGIRLIGMTYLSDENSVVQGCTLNDISQYSIGLDYQTFMDISDNQVNFPTSNDNLASTIYGIYSYELFDSSVHNNTLSGGNVTKSVTSMQIHMSSNIEIHHNTISGMRTTSAWWQGLTWSSHTDGATNVHHNEIYDIESGMIAWPINGSASYSVNINDNHVHNIKAGASIWGIHCIQSAGLDHAANIYNNEIHDLEITGQSIQLVSGINAQDRYVNIFNNMVYDIRMPVSNYVNWDGGPQIAGISMKDMQAAEGERGYVYNNTVLLDGSGTDNFSSACFYTNFPGPVDLKNNIFVNNSTPGINGKAAAFWKATETFDNYVATMDQNIYYAGTPGASNLIYYDGINSAQTLAEYKALNVGKDQNSYTENVPFVSAVAPYDLHIDPTVPTYVEGRGIYLPTVLIDDIDGDIRSMTPDIGADEGDFTPREDEITLGAPENVTITISGTNVEISWDAVDGATGYYVYGSDEPYADTPWGTPVMTVNAPDTTAAVSPSSQFKFYYISAFE
ncbi:MAG: hypothetical protein RBR69_09695 [Candidatus Cloacimonadaceae bacterium]|jgi:hypothetical protein|nr:hypothetical protein [Candidatus Cloacimonadaceae bacterium]